MPPLPPAADAPAVQGSGIENADGLPPRRLAELAALGEEAAAFAKAGLPLEVGLGAGRAGGLSEQIARRLREGQSLPDAYAAERGPLPAAMRAVLESGVRSGRPGEALVRVADHARLVTSLRAELGAALIGPLAVVAAAVTLAAWVLPIAAARLADLMRQVGAEVSPPVRILGYLGSHHSDWLFFAPLIVTAVVAVLAKLTGWRLLSWLPGVRGVRGELRRAGAAHLLSLLTAADVPLGEAVRLAAGAAGRTAAARLNNAADRLEAGEGRAAVFDPNAPNRAAAVPPLFAWTLGTVAAVDLPAVLAEVADLHARRARAAAGRCAAAWPLAATVLVGGGVLLGYVYGVAGPAVDLLEAAARPLGPGTP